MFYVYILQSIKNNQYYVGSTNNLIRRLDEHNSNKTKSLKNRGPFEVIYFEEYENLSLARQREYKIKSYRSGNEFKKLINKK